MAVADRNAGKIAFSAMISALCVALMVVGRVVSIADYCISAICGILIGVVVIELGNKWALASYAVVSALGILLGSAEAAITFAVFVGYFPVIKPYIEKLPKWLSFVLKLLIFNVTICLVYFLLDRIGILPLEEISMLGKYTNVALLILGNVVYILYDYAFNGVMGLYYVRIHPIVNKIIKK